MTLQQLTYLVTVAECGNITDAAERLFLSQPSLSAAIHNLEKEMGVTAFVRSNKGVTVTQEGEELLSFARMLLEQADIMQEHFGVGKKRVPKFCVSCQHYSFAVNAFVEVVKEYNADQYGSKNAIINLPQRSSPRGKFFYYKKSEWRCKNVRSKKSNYRCNASAYLRDVDCRI